MTMLVRLPFLPERASTFANDVDALYFFLIVISIFFTTLIATLIVVFAWRYRRRAKDERGVPVHGSLALELTWTLIPLVLVFVIFGWGATIFFGMNRPPSNAMEISVVGKRWMWKIQHPNGRREINELHVPVGVPVQVTLTSEDVIHSFYVPAFRIKKDAIPGRYATTWFEATKVGEYHLFCSEYCGTGHSGMIGSVIVMEPAAFQAWLAGGPPPASPVEAGRKLFNDLACAACHQTESLARGPGLAGIFGRKTLLSTGETAIADENYLRESIMRPAEKVVAGYQPVMPTYQGQISESDMLNLIAYLRSLEADAAAPTPTRAAGREKP
jgi:cytochrome c oxidase subunit 2